MGCSPSAMATTSPKSFDRATASYNDLKNSTELSERLSNKETDSSVQAQKPASPTGKQAKSRVEKQEEPEHTEVKTELVANDDLKKTKKPSPDKQTDPSVDPHKQSSLTVKQADSQVEKQEKPEQNQVKAEIVGNDDLQKTKEPSPDKQTGPSVEPHKQSSLTVKKADVLGETKEKPKETEMKTESRDKVDVKPEESAKIKDFGEFCKDTFELVRQSAKILDADNFSFSDAERLPNIEHEIRRINSFYFAAQKCFERHDYERFQILFCDVVLDSNQLRFYEKILHEVPKSVDFDELNTGHEAMFFFVMNILHNCTDLSDCFAEAVSDSIITVYIKQILDINSARYLKGELKPYTNKIISSCHGIVHNLSMRGKNIERLRKLEMVATLQPYLESKQEMTRISTLATLANIVTEKECNIINSHDKVVGLLLLVVTHGAKKKERRFNGWSCKESIFAIRQLARNDANKKLLVQLGTIKVLVDVAAAEDKGELREIVNAFLQLSFDDVAKKLIVHDENLKAMDLLMKLRKPADENDEDDKYIADLCVKTLWNLRDEIKESKVQTYREAVGELFTSMKTETDQKQHIMISYQSENRAFLVKVKERLKENGYKVWMDVEQMCGDILETMAQGVENAAVILVCFSRKYKESGFCRQEAQYAHKMKKPMIPLKMEEGYEPDGWLGFMLASEYFVNFSGKYIADSSKEEEKVQDLFRQIKKKWKSGQDFVDSPVTEQKKAPVLKTAREEAYASHGSMPTKTTAENKQNRTRLLTIRDWSNDDVHKWLTNNSLENIGLDNITGLEVSLLAKMMSEAPDQLYQCLRRDLKIETLITKARLVWALEELINGYKCD